MIKNIFFLITAYTLVGGIIFLYKFSAEMAISFVIGGLTMLINMAGLVWFWRLVIYKKSIALVVIIIIFKYLILGIILWSLASIKWLSPVAFVSGLAALLFAIIFALIIKNISFKVKKVS